MAEYIGPGDIASGAFAWWGFRAYNNAYISGAKHIVDLTDSGGSNPITLDCDATGAFRPARVARMRFGPPRMA